MCMIFIISNFILWFVRCNTTILKRQKLIMTLIKSIILNTLHVNVGVIKFWQRGKFTIGQNVDIFDEYEYPFAACQVLNNMKWGLDLFSMQNNDLSVQWVLHSSEPKHFQLGTQKSLEIDCPNHSFTLCGFPNRTSKTKFWYHIHP